MSGRGPQQYSFGPPVTPQIIKTLIIANVVVFFAQMATADSGLVTRFGVVSPAAVWSYGEFWTPFTYMWLHSPGGLMHIAFNMFAIWMFGSPLALAWGEQRFLRYYLVCGVGAGVLIATVPYLPVVAGYGPLTNLGIPTLGASGAVMGLLLAYSFTWPDRTIMLIFPPIPLKAIWLIPMVLVMELMGPSNVSHLGHVGGILVGWIYLVREGRTPGAPTISNLQHRYKRYQMRQRMRAVHDEERRRRNSNDRTFH